MAKAKKSKHLETFIQSIKDEWKGAYRKSPEMTIMALQDDQVVAAIEKRFSDQSSILGVRQLDYDFYTGLHNLVFEFSAGIGNIGRPGIDAFLAILDSNGQLIALVDPFDPAQPNKFVPPLPTQSEQPFVLERPSVSQQVTFSDEDMVPLQVRSREFMMRLTAGNARIAGDDIVIYVTRCAYTTDTNLGKDYWTDYQNDDCGLPDDILA